MYELYFENNLPNTKKKCSLLHLLAFVLYSAIFQIIYLALKHLKVLRNSGKFNQSTVSKLLKMILILAYHLHFLLWLIEALSDRICNKLPFSAT